MLSLGSTQASYEGYIDTMDTAIPYKHVKETYVRGLLHYRSNRHIQCIHILIDMFYTHNIAS